MDKLNRISLILLSFLVALILITNIIKLFDNETIDYIQAIKVTAYDEIESFGVFLREETIVDDKLHNYMHITVESGQRIGNNQVLANIYSNASYLQISEQIEDLKREKEVLANITSSNMSNVESTKISLMINDKIAQLNHDIDKNNLKATTDIVTEIQNTSLKSAYSQMSKEELAVEKNALEEQIRQKELLLESNVTSIKSPISGSFILGIDGYEGLLDVNVDDIENLEKEGRIINKADQKLGKIITEYVWSFACAIDNDKVDAIGKSKNLQIVFSDLPTNYISISVKEVIAEEFKSVVIFTGNFTNEQILEMRTSDVRIVLNSYDGISIPKKSTRVIDNKIGVYTLSGNRSVYKEIEPIFETSDSYIIKIKPSTEIITQKDIIAGDKIITSSKYIKDNQIVK